MSYRTFLLVCVCVCACACATLAGAGKVIDPRKVVWTANCGSDRNIRMKDGYIIEWDKEYGMNEESIIADYSNDPLFKNKLVRYTEDARVYRSERHAHTNLRYYPPIGDRPAGPYVLIMKFCESYFDQPEKRIFNIKIGDRRIVQNLDLVEKAGKNGAWDEYIEFNYNNGAVYYKGQKIPNGVRDGRLIVEFEKTEYDNPLVNAILLVQGTLDDTDYSEYMAKRQEWVNKWEKYIQYEEIE